MRLLCSLAVVALFAVGVTGCSSADDVGPGWAIVKVDILDGPPLASICIDSMCAVFDPDGDVRAGEFSAFVDVDTTFEVLRVGEVPSEGATGGSPVGGCMLLGLASDAGTFVAGCHVSPTGAET